VIRWAIVLFEQVLKTKNANKIFWQLFLHGKSTLLILTKKSLAIFGAIFSQTHLVIPNLSKNDSKDF
jgi:hypothetical protein